MSVAFPAGAPLIRPFASVSKSHASALPLCCRKRDVGNKIPAEARPRNRRRQFVASASPPSSTLTTTAQPPPLEQQKHRLDAEAEQLRHGLSNRSKAFPDPFLLEKSRALALSLAAARREVSAQAASFLDALAGAVARSLSPPAPPPTSVASLEANARLVKAYAQLGHATLATSELARAVVVQARRGLVAAPALTAAQDAPPIPAPAVPAFCAAASIARSVSRLGTHPGERLTVALSSSAIAFEAESSASSLRSTSVGAVGGGATTADGDVRGTSVPRGPPARLPSRLPASAVVDWLCACAACGSVPSPGPVVDLAASARFNPIQAATAAAALASVVGRRDAVGGGVGGGAVRSPPARFETLVSTLRSRVAGSPRGGVPPRAAVAAAWALACWGQLDAPSAVALAEHAEAGVAADDLPADSIGSCDASGIFSSAISPSLLPEEDLACFWRALRASGWSAVSCESGERDEGGADEGGADDARAEGDVAFVVPGDAAVSPRAQRAARAARRAAMAFDVQISHSSV